MCGASASGVRRYSRSLVFLDTNRPPSLPRPWSLMESIAQQGTGAAPVERLGSVAGTVESLQSWLAEIGAAEAFEPLRREEFETVAELRELTGLRAHEGLADIEGISSEHKAAILRALEQQPPESRAETARDSVGERDSENRRREESSDPTQAQDNGEVLPEEEELLEEAMEADASTTAGIKQAAAGPGQHRRRQQPQGQHES